MTGDSQTSIVRSFSQDDFDCFARLSGDNNPIHVDPEYAASSRFGRTVAHGLLLCSVLRGLIEILAPGGHVVGQSVMFPAPTFADEQMRFTAILADKSQKEGKAQLDFKLQVMRIADQVVTCQGQAEVVM